MSTTVRILKEDKAKLERLAKRTGKKKMIDAFRLALDLAERETDKFEGNMKALIDAQKASKSVGGDVSERIDDELAKAIRHGRKEERAK